MQWLDSRKKNDKKIKDYDQEKQNLLTYQSADKQEIKDFKILLTEKEDQQKSLSENIKVCKSYGIKKLRWEKELLENQRDQESLDQEVSLLSDMIYKSQEVTKQNQNKTENLSWQEQFALLEQEKQKLTLDRKALEKNLEQHKLKQSQQEKEFSNRQTEVMQNKMNLNNLELSLEKKEFEKEHLRKHFMDMYKMEIENFISPAVSSEESDLETLQKERDYYQKKLDSMEGLNFLALQEYEALSKDHLFLNSQKEDLVKSRKEILKVISHIDKLCETRFKNMLEEINKRFSKVFPIIFHGDQAKAELILHEEAGHLEPGVDILIHPPGKRPQSVTLLSRGEKALTSICLIYSLFLVKPSPFCIIDEADAPLDDANIFRFISVLKEMSQKSQIITITHNKYTMQACKKLYGVTMDKPGISQVVSVDMDSKTLPLSENQLSGI